MALLFLAGNARSSAELSHAAADLQSAAACLSLDHSRQTAVGT